jgi:hypothetical protein
MTNSISEILLKDDAKFKNHKRDTFNKEEKHIKKVLDGKNALVEGFATDSNSSARASSNHLMHEITKVQNAGNELNELQGRFSSTLERYKTAKAQILTSTNSFIKDNQKIVEGSLVGKNIYVNQVASNPVSDYVGAYADKVAEPSMTKMVGEYTYDQCELSAVNNGKQFFALSNSNSLTEKGACSTTNDLSAAEKYGLAGSNCTQGSDGYLYGGESTNAIYQVPDAQFVGNYGDTPNRAMPTFANGGSRTYTYDTCKKAAVDGGFKLFGLQWYSGGDNGYAQCALSNDFTAASQYGQSGSKFSNGVGQTVGGGWANAIYQVQSNNSFIGCYKDSVNSPAMTPVGNGDSTYTVDTCQQAAITSGSKYFALQGGTQGKAKCFVSNSLSESTKYGESKPTTTFLDKKMYGNNEVNAIYKVTSRGHPNNLGKAGYINDLGDLLEYPKPMIKVVNGVPTIISSDKSCGKEIVNIDSYFWQNQKKSGEMMSPSTKCGLSSAIQADQASALELGQQLQVMSSRILELINYLETLDSNVIRQIGTNKSKLNDMLINYTEYNSQFHQYKNVDLDNYNSILEDSKIVASQQNYSYILWSGLAVIVLLFSLRLIKK